jgi:diguanylate cyclase (GGDEF)-like protein/PAS domain S-box-containing protein
MTDSASILNTANQLSQVNPWSIVCAPNGSTEEERSATRLNLNMVQSRLGVVSSLYVALRAKHGPAATHSLRVALWASAWGIQNQLHEEHLQLFEIVGLLHEIGKIGIPDRVLQKPDKLNDNEQAMMDLHPQVGLEILRAAGATNDLLLSVAGVGTSFSSSNNCNSKEISPLVSRLISIIDAYDSMTVTQVYRAAMSRESALAEIFRLSGTQFDPKLARSFAEVVLSPQLQIHEQVRERWVSQIEIHPQTRFFDLDSPLGHRPSDYTSSALVHTLNDTFYRHMMDHVQDGVIFIDSEYRVLDWNSSAERMTGKTAESVFHQHWSPAFACLCDDQGFALTEEQCPFHALMETGQKISQRLSIRRDNEPLLHVNVEVVPVHNEAGQICGGAIILEDISETAVLEQKIVHLRERASQDQLTKVANRGELNRQLPEFVAYHQRKNRVGSVIICDIDFFKRINDNFSHQAGDEALIIFANILKDSCRDSDFVARYGGEEFVILCGQCDFSEAKELAESIRKKLHRTPIPALRNACMTASFGVSTVLPGDTDESVLGRADQGLLIAKESGRDRVVGLGAEANSLSESGDGKEADRATTSWFRWLIPSQSAAKKFELVTNVPRNVTLEKLKGFVQEYHATVVHVENDSAVLEVDCRNTPIPQSQNERLGKFRVTINISEIEMQSTGRSKEVKICTLLELEIRPVRSRDRRSEAVLSQIARLKASIQGILLANELDQSMRENILRKIKPEKDSRY